MSGIKRRAFITLLGGAAAAWPLAARAQQPERMRRIGLLMNRAANNPEGQARLAAFQQGLQQLGWIDGRSINLQVRYADNRPDRMLDLAREAVALKPALIYTHGSVAMVSQVARTSL